MRGSFSERISQMTPSGIRKVNERTLQMEREGQTVYHFEIGRPDFDTPEYIKEACIRSIQNGDVFYTSNVGYQELREKIATYLYEKKKIAVTDQNILVTVGLAEAVFDVLTALLVPGDEILVPDPVWMNYINIPKLLGAVPKFYSLLEKRNYQPDIREMEAAVTEKTKAIVLVNPSNPTGSMLEEDTLMAIADLAIQKDLIVISDEIYERLIYEKPHISIASLPGMKERTVTLNGFSKTYSMTGWRIGYLAAPAEWVTLFNKIHQVNTTSATSFVQKAAITALDKETDEVQKMRQEYKRRRDYAVATINRIPGLSCMVPDGAFYIFINLTGLHVSSAEFADKLLEEEKVAMVPGDVFGQNVEGYLRMSFANSMENIKEGLLRLERAARTYIDN